MLASGGWSGLLVWAVIGAVCGGLYAYFTEHLLKKNELERIGTRMSRDSSALLLYVHGADTKELLDDVAPEEPSRASVATIGSDLSATVTHGAQSSAEVSTAASASDPPNHDALLSMLVFRYAGADSAAQRPTPRVGRPSTDKAADR